MQGLVEEVLISPVPLVCVLGDKSESLDILSGSLRSAGYAQAPRPATPLRYEAFPFAHQFAPRLRSHTEQEYASYIPVGILPSNWLGKHQNAVPAVMVRGP
jgi:hypothetical protein